MNEVYIQIGLYEALGFIIAFSGTLITIAWIGGARLARLETHIESIGKRLTTLEGLFFGAFSRQSPIALTEKGRVLLEKSGLKEYLDANKSEFVKLVQPDIDTDATAYDIQDAAFDMMNSLSFSDEFETKLKQYAYESGSSIELLRRVAGIYFRDIVLEEYPEKITLSDTQE